MEISSSKVLVNMSSSPVCINKDLGPESASYNISKVELMYSEAIS